MDRYRVECTRRGLEHAPGLVGDFDTIKDAREAAVVAKADNPGIRATVTPGTDTPWDEQPDERKHPFGHHFLPTGDPEEVA